MKKDGILYTIANKLRENFVLMVLSRTMVATIPVMLTGSVASIIILFAPFAIVKDIMQPFATLTLSSLSPYLAVAVGYFYGKLTNNESIAFALISLCVFLVLIPQDNKSIPILYFSSYGMFVALISSFLVCVILDNLIKIGFVFTLPSAVDEAIRRAFFIIPAFFVSGLVFVCIKELFTLTSYGNVFNFIYTLLQKPMVTIACSYWGFIFAMVIIQLFWFIGMPGDVIVSSIFAPLWLSASMENFAAYSAGLERTYIISGGFFYQFALFTSFTPLILAILAFSKNKHARSMAKVAFMPAIFNVQEPINYGLPVTLRSSLFIPWIASRIVATTIAYLAMHYEIVPKTTGIIVPWATPLFLSGILVCSSIKGAVLQALILVVCFMLFIPFIKGLDNEIEETSKVNNSK